MKEKWEEERKREGGGIKRRNIKYCSRREKMHVMNNIDKCFAKSTQKFDVSKFSIPPSPTALL